jgi:hypothetical protein
MRIEPDRRQEKMSVGGAGLFVRGKKKSTSTLELAEIDAGGIWE